LAVFLVVAVINHYQFILVV